jgi:hypothetical protein
MRLASSVLVAAALAGCDRPRVLVVCHNSNCSDPHDLDRDDTISALLDSLALRIDDRPVLDGTELDVFWHEGRCWFAHDAGGLGRAEDFSAAASALADHLRSTPDASHDGEHFVVVLELKPQVGTLDLQGQVDCAMSALMTIRTGAVAGGHALDAIVDSFEPAALRLVQSHPSFVISGARLSADLGFTHRFGTPLADLAGIDLSLALVHPGWTTEATLQAMRSMELEVIAWSFDATTETLEGTAKLDPDYVLTGQARLVRKWLSY